MKLIQILNLYIFEYFHKGKYLEIKMFKIVIKILFVMIMIFK